jgi:release factor glutamine methyltransferase
VPETGAGTIAAALGAATRTLAGAGHAEPRREALRLGAIVAGVTPGDLWLGRDRALDPALDERWTRAVAARARGAPVAYATGRVSFRAVDLVCDARALIPRPETEGLVDLVLRPRMGDEGWGRRGLAADLGTGTGCLALALAVEGDFDLVVAVERDPAAAALARENVARVAPPTPVEVREGDWLGPMGDARYRVILANPPYLTEDEWSALDPAVRDHEPRVALASGPDGLDATRAILAGAARRLAPGGVLALEIDERRADAVRELAGALGWRRVAIHDDLFGRPRYAVASMETHS